MDRFKVLVKHFSIGNVDSSQETCLGLRRSATSARLTGTGNPVLIGGIVMDVQAKPNSDADVTRGGSVPGKVQQTPGGVARNICECLALLCNSDLLPASARARLRPILVSVLGQDQAGNMLLAHLQSMGLLTHAIHRIPGASTPSVSIIFDKGGEVAASVADVAALEEHLPAVLGQHKADIQSALIIMLDGNLSPDALLEAAQLASDGGVPIWYEPVSAPKAARAASALHMMDYISPNASELVSIAKTLKATRQQPRQTSGTAHQGRPHHKASMGSSTIADSSHNGSSKFMYLPSSTPVPASRLHRADAELKSQHAANDASSSGSQWIRPSSAEDSAEVGVSGEAGSAGTTVEARNAVERLRPHLCAVLCAGVKRVVLTLGRLGAALCTLSGDGRWLQIEHLAAPHAVVVNTSGAGDCLVAGSLWGLLRGCSPVEALAQGMAVAHQAVQSSSSVPKDIDAQVIQQSAGVVLKTLQRWHFPVQQH
ncbi:probable pseudouridine kinase at N-terminal half [Coccomyxa sp. Obi]|nr:probable pseudouridine kinase at N-terminal half [Coccomyxa sp. Obi]